MDRIDDKPENNLEELIKFEKNLKIDKKDSYIISYPFIRDWFRGIRKFDESHFVCGVHMVYGWMPRVLRLHPDTTVKVGDKSVNVDLRRGTDILTQLKKNQDISESELKQLKRLVDNSLVASSKLFHFVAPETFAIWDSNVCKYFFPGAVKKMEDYWKYINRIRLISKLDGCKGLRDSVYKKVGYDISFVRAIELVIYLYMKQQ